MSPRTLLRLALAGTRTDTLRVAVTALSAALGSLAMLAAATVLVIRGASSLVGGGAPISGGAFVGGSNGWAEQYRSQLLVEPGLRPGVAATLLLLTIPVLALAAQCSRLGAPARERRLAAIRLAGATPRQAVGVAAAETGVASALGAGAGLCAYMIGRMTLHDPDERGRLALPTDVRLAPWLLAAICVATPLLAAGLTAGTLRKVVIGPFGVIRRVRTARPGPWPGLLIAAGIAAFVAFGYLLGPGSRYAANLPRQIPSALLFGGAACAALGVALGAAWISYATGRVMLRLARRPTTLLAARRLLDDPWSGSRTFGTLLVAVIVGAGAAAVRALFIAERDLSDQAQREFAAATGEPYVPFRDEFYTSSMDLVDAAVTVAALVAAAALLVALAERMVSRRTAHAALVATGVPRGVLARSALWQAATPMVPAIGLALTVGAALPRGIQSSVSGGGYTQTVCTAPPGVHDLCWGPEPDPRYLIQVTIPKVTEAVPVPWDRLGVIGLGTLAVILAMVGLSLLFLRTSTNITELRAG